MNLSQMIIYHCQRWKGIIYIRSLICQIVTGNQLVILSINQFYFRIDVFEKIFYLARKKLNMDHFLNHLI